jgi:hypothetical protein
MSRNYYAYTDEENLTYYLSVATEAQIKYANDLLSWMSGHTYSQAQWYVLMTIVEGDAAAGVSQVYSIYLGIFKKKYLDWVENYNTGVQTYNATKTNPSDMRPIIVWDESTNTEKKVVAGVVVGVNTSNQGYAAALQQALSGSTSGGPSTIAQKTKQADNFLTRNVKVVVGISSVVSAISIGSIMSN